mgnify:FL=1
MLKSAAPAIFTTTQDGRGPGAILGPRGLVTAADPVSRGDVVAIYATGLGAVSPAAASGAPAPSEALCRTTDTPVVNIGGVEAEVLFSGLAPGFIGLYQVNARLRPHTPTGDNVPVVLQYGSTSSNVVTLAIR